MDAAGLATRLEARLTRGRRAAEARMLSRATVRRKTGNRVPDPTDPEYEVDEWAVVATDSPGRLAGGRGAGASRTVTVGSAEVQVAAREWHMPVTGPLLADGDLIEVTAGENAGLVFRAVESAGQDQATARRVPVVEVPRPTEWA